MPDKNSNKEMNSRPGTALLLSTIVFYFVNMNFDITEKQWVIIQASATLLGCLKTDPKIFRFDNKNQNPRDQLTYWFLAFTFFCYLAELEKSGLGIDPSIGKIQRDLARNFLALMFVILGIHQCVLPKDTIVGKLESKTPHFFQEFKAVVNHALPAIIGFPALVGPEADLRELLENPHLLIPLEVLTIIWALNNWLREASPYPGITGKVNKMCSSYKENTFTNLAHRLGIAGPHLLLLSTHTALLIMNNMSRTEEDQIASASYKNQMRY